MRARAILFTCLAFAVCLPVDGLATDSKITPGVMCQPVNGDSIENINWGNSGDVRTEASTQTVNCAVIHDVVSSSINDLEVNVDPVFGVGNEILCTGWAANRTTSAFYATPDVESNGGGSPQVLDLGYLPGFSRGSYWVNCVVPVQGKIISIDTEEID